MNKNNIVLKPGRNLRLQLIQSTITQYRQYLNQDFLAYKPNQIWVADITYIPTDEDWLYFAAIVNLYNKKVVG